MKGIAGLCTLLCGLLLGACTAPGTSPREFGASSGPFLPVAPSPVSADNDHRAGVFIDVARCGMFDGSGNIVTLDAHVNVQTESRTGAALHNCFAQVPNPSGQAIRYDADNNPLGVRIACGIGDGQGNIVWTFDHHQQISASGQAHLICVVKGSSEG